MNTLNSRKHSPVLSLMAVASLAVGAMTTLASTTTAAERSPLATSDAFSVTASPATVAVGEDGFVTITIEAKGDHKVNKDYPHRVKLSPATEGFELLKSVLKKDDGRFSGPKTFTFRVPVKGKSSGAHTLAGKVKFSVCNASQCMIKKVEVSAPVNVK